MPIPFLRHLWRQPNVALPDEAEAGLHAPSLRRNLNWLLCCVVLIAAAIQAAGIYRVARQETEAVFDAQMQRMALTLSGGLAASVLSNEGELDDTRGPDWIVQVWRSDGIMLYRSASARLLPQQAVIGFSNLKAHGRNYRVYGLTTPTQVIQIAQTEASRSEMAGRLALRAVLPVALLAPLIMLLVWWVVTRALAPLERTRQQVAARQASDLSPLARDGLPAEVQPLLVEMNLLLARLQTAWDALQHFVADAAHELRSPLTALRLQVQSLQRADTPEKRELATTRLIAGIDRATRLVEQLLALARQQGQEVKADACEPVDLHALCARALAEAEPLARTRQQQLHLQPPAADAQPMPWRVHAAPVETLLRNLLENAMRYTPEGGQVQLSVVPEPGLAGEAPALALVVEDSGPGIAPEERGRVLDRFYRVPGTTAMGSGLGLAIVQSVAQLHGATLTLDSSPRLGGLRVRVRFPAQPPQG